MLFRGNLLKVGAIALLIVLGLGVGLWTGPTLLKQWNQAKATEGNDGKQLSVAELVGADTIRLPSDVVETLGVKSVPVVAATEPRRMELSGSLGLDTNTLARIRPIFPGVVVEVGTTKPGASLNGPTQPRPLDFGDPVEEGQLLAVILSKDLGTMKSQFLTALSQLELDKRTRDNLRKLYEKGSVPLRSVLEAEQKVDADVIAVDAARRTLLSWRLTPDDITKIAEEADRVRKGESDPKSEANWARYELKSPMTGKILERTVVNGETVNDNTLDLFKIGDTRKLRVWANAYEEQLAILQRLPKPIKWRVRFPGDPLYAAKEGEIEGISDIIDPSDHTAKIRGHVKNEEGELRAAQFVTAIIDIPPGPGEVQIPTAAVVDDGRESIVFVQTPDTFEYTLRHVQIVRRTDKLATVRADPGEPTKDAPPAQPLKVGERVVTSGAVELQAALDDLKSAPKK